MELTCKGYTKVVEVHSAFYKNHRLVLFLGAQIGNVLALPLSALLCDYGFDGGWPSIFYILGKANPDFF